MPLLCTAHGNVQPQINHDRSHPYNLCHSCCLPPPPLPRNASLAFPDEDSYCCCGRRTDISLAFTAMNGVCVRRARRANEPAPPQPSTIIVKSLMFLVACFARGARARNAPVAYAAGAMTPPCLKRPTVFCILHPNYSFFQNPGEEKNTKKIQHGKTKRAHQTWYYMTQGNQKLFFCDH